MDYNDQKHNSFYYIFFQVIREHYKLVHILLDKIGVYPGQPPMLMILSREDGLSQKELSDRLKIKPATITVMLGRMEKSGLVERHPDLDDQRVQRVYITDKGKKLSVRVSQVMETLERECIKNFTIEEQVLFRRFLMQMKDNITNAIKNNYK